MNEEREQTAASVELMREYIYADIDRARSIFAQLVGGVPEEGRLTEGTSRKFSLGAKSLLSLNIDRDRKAEESVQRSLLDAILPELEAILLTEGWLTDMTDQLEAPTGTPEEIQGRIIPGSLVRLVGNGQLFDTRHLAEVLAGASIAIEPISRLDPKPRPPKAGGTAKTTGKPRTARNSGNPELEDSIMDFDPDIFGGTRPGQLRDLVRLSRGLFSTGLHLRLQIAGSANWSIAARLQEGRRYLDAEPDVLFSRYGTTPQDWHIIGTIGHYAPAGHEGWDDIGLVVSETDHRLDRSKMLDTFSRLLQYFAHWGVSEGPAYPGFSIVPIAVYRPIPKAIQ